MNMSKMDTSRAAARPRVRVYVFYYVYYYTLLSFLVVCVGKERV